MTENKIICKKCGGDCSKSKAIINLLSASSEWNDGDMLGATLSPSNEGKLINCLKCKKCGHSFSTSIPPLSKPLISSHE